MDPVIAPCDPEDPTVEAEVDIGTSVTVGCGMCLSRDEDLSLKFCGVTTQIAGPLDPNSTFQNLILDLNQGLARNKHEQRRFKTLK